MADSQNSLPVRTENNADVKAAIVDATLTNQSLAIDAQGKVSVKLNDGSGLEITSQANGSQQALDVGINVAGVQVDPRSIRALTDADIVTVVQPTHDLLNANVNLQVGDADVSGANPVPTSTTNGALETTQLLVNGHVSNIDTATAAINGKIANNYGAATGAVRTASQIGNATGAADFNVGATTAQTLRTVSNLMDEAGNAFTVANSLPVQVSDGADTLAVNTDGSINVRILDNTPGTDIADYNTAAAVAGGASSVHTYTSTGNFYLTQVESSGSGRMRIQIAIDGVTKFTLFNTEATPNMSLVLKNPILVTSTQTVTVTRMNRGNQAFDVYSTVIGYVE